MIHKCCHALAGSFVRNESLVPQGILSRATPQGAFSLPQGTLSGSAIHLVENSIHLGAIHLIPQGILSRATPQGTFSAASGMYLGAIHLIGRP